MELEELEKENAELKARLNAINILTPELQKISKEKTDQLTTAKELLKKLYSHVFQGMDFMELNDYNVLKADAENFLKESEVEK
jgi:hypothetical protein